MYILEEHAVGVVHTDSMVQAEGVLQAGKFGQDEGGLVNSTNESFDNEDDEDEDEDDDDEEEEEVGDVPASSSSGIEEGAQS